MRYIALSLLIAGFAFGRAGAQTAMPSPTAAPTPAPSAATAGQTGWRTDITPYVWVPNVNGQFTFTHPALAAIGNPGSVGINVHVGPNSYLSKLNFVAMLSAYASNGTSSYGADYIYINASTSTADVVSVTGPHGKIEFPVNVSTSARVRGSLLTLELGKSLTQNTNSPMEFVGGVRYLGSTTSVDWNFTGPLDILARSGSASANQYVWDPLMGLRGRIGLGSNLFVPYYADFGVGAQNLTNQELIGLGWAQRWGDIVIVNRWLQYSFTNPGATNIQLVGPALGARIHL